MPLYEFEGTRKNRFSIGTGENQVEFSSIAGKVFFKNFNGTWKEIPGANDITRLKVREWVTGYDYDVGEVIAYNGILYIVATQFQASVTFDSDLMNLNFISSFDGVMTISPINNSEYDLFKSTGTFVYVEQNVNNGHINVYLPDALSLNIGHTIRIQNSHYNFSVSVYANDRSTLVSFVNPKAMQEFVYVGVSGNNGNWTTTIPTSIQIFEWLPNKPYNVNEIVSYEGSIYRCELQHTSTTNFLSDLANGLWFDFNKSSRYNSVIVTQAAHGFALWDLVAKDPTDGLFHYANASNANRTTTGMVGRLIDANNFELITGGIIKTTPSNPFPFTSDGDPIEAGQQYFLSNIDGKFTDQEPFESGIFIKDNVFQCIDLYTISMNLSLPVEYQTSLKPYVTTINLLAGIPQNVSHNLALTDKNHFVFRASELASGVTLSVGCKAVDINTVEITSDVDSSGVLIYIAGS